MASPDLSRPSVRKQLDAIVTRAEVILEAELAAGRHRSVDIMHSVHVAGITFDYDVDVHIEVAPRAKQVFGKRMCTYRIKLMHDWSAIGEQVKKQSGQASLGLNVWLERRSTFIKWGAAAVRMAALLNQANEFNREVADAKAKTGTH